MPETGAIAVMPSGHSIRPGARLRRRLLRQRERQQVRQAGLQDPDLWRLGRDRHGGGTAGEILWGRRHGGRRRRGTSKWPGRLARIASSTTLNPNIGQLGRSFDFVLDAVGKMKVRDWRRLLNPDGHFAVTDLGPGGRDVPFMLWSAVTGDGRVSCPLPPRGSARQFVHFLKERMEAGQFRAVVDRKYPARCDRRRLPLCLHRAKRRASS